MPQSGLPVEVSAGKRGNVAKFANRPPTCDRIITTSQNNFMPPEETTGLPVEWGGRDYNDGTGLSASSTSNARSIHEAGSQSANVSNDTLYERSQIICDMYGRVGWRSGKCYIACLNLRANDIISRSLAGSLGSLLLNLRSRARSLLQPINVMMSDRREWRRHP